MNTGAHIAMNPLTHCAYFLSLINRPKVKGWVNKQYHWLKDIERIPALLPVGQNAWVVLEEKFKTAFQNYAESVCAQEQLKALKMKEGNVDEYITMFKLLGFKAKADLDNPFLLTQFA